MSITEQDTEQDTFDLDALASTLAEVIENLEAPDDDTSDTSDSEPDPMAHVTVEMIHAGHGLDAKDRKRMTYEERQARKVYMDKMRKRRARAQVKRSKIAQERDKRPLDVERMRVMLTIIGANLIDLTTTTVIARYNRFRRVMGDVMIEDIAHNAIISIAESFTRTDHEIVDVALAAQWLATAPQPIDTQSEDAPRLARALFGAVVRKSGHAIVDAYRTSTCKMLVPTIGDEGETVWIEKDTTLESLEYLTTMIKATGGDVDSLLARHQASGKPKHSSKPPPHPYGRVFARMCVDAAITERGLDWLVELVMNEARTDGSMAWTEHKDVIWDRLMGGIPMPEVSERAQVHYVRRAVGMAFEFLPDVIMTVNEMVQDPEFMSTLTPMAEQRIVAAAQQHDNAKHTQINLVTNLDRTMKEMYDGARYLLVGMEEGEAPVQLHTGPDDSEWKRIIKVEDGTMNCAHGVRQRVVGVSKKAHKHPRSWSGEFCCQPKGAPDQCDPIFRGQGDSNATPAQALDSLSRALDSAIIEVM